MLCSILRATGEVPLLSLSLLIYLAYLLFPPSSPFFPFSLLLSDLIGWSVSPRLQFAYVDGSFYKAIVPSKTFTVSVKHICVPLDSFRGISISWKSVGVCDESYICIYIIYYAECTMTDEKTWYHTWYSFVKIASGDKTFDEIAFTQLIFF